MIVIMIMASARF